MQAIERGAVWVRSHLWGLLHAVVDAHARAELPRYYGPYGPGAWWSR
jgi:hypothetical protein